MQYFLFKLNLRYTIVIAEVQSVGTGTSCLTRRTIVAKGEQMI
jgi:hypothetical protein